jgi:hypothetical protein
MQPTRTAIADAASQRTAPMLATDATHSGTIALFVASIWHV